MAKQRTKDQSQYPIVAKLAALKDKIGPRDLEFARSLVTNFNKYGRLSDKQMYFVDQIIARTENPPPPPQPVVHVSVAMIQQLFANAAQKLKRVKVTLQTPDGQNVVFKKAGPASKYAGQVVLSDGGPFGLAKFFGRIDTDGAFIPSKISTDSIKDLVVEFAASPEHVAGKYGKLTGACCFCSRPLNDDRSVAVGYGPQCAKHFGLQWGATA